MRGENLGHSHGKELDIANMSQQEIISYLRQMSPEQLNQLDTKIATTMLNRARTNTANLTIGVLDGEAPEVGRTRKKVFGIFGKTG